MKKITIMKTVSIITIIALAIVLFPMKVYAAGSFSASISKSTIEKGGTFSVSITANDCAGKFTISSSGNVTLNESEVFADSTTVTVTGTAVSAGTSTITITAADVSDFDKQPVTGSKTVSITVNEPQPDPEPEPDPVPTPDPEPDPKPDPDPIETKKSDDCYLKSLKTNPEGLSPEFSKKTTEYTLNVSSETDKVEIDAKANDSSAKSVKVSGNTNLKEGDNKISIVVTAEDGSTKTYTINAVRATSIKLGLATLAIEGLTLDPVFSSEVYAYKAILDKTNVTELKIATTTTIEGAQVEITGNKDLKEGENLVTILVKKEGQEPVTYQITVTKAEKKLPLLTNQPVEEKKEFTIQQILIVVFTSIIAIAGIVFGIIEYRYNKKGNKVMVEEEDNYMPDLDEIIPEEEETTQGSRIEDLLQQESQQIEGKESEQKPSGDWKKGKHF